MKLLQRVVASVLTDRAARRLSAVAARASVSTGAILRAIESAEALRCRRPNHFGLTYALGLACERMACDVSWNERQPWLERALWYYNTAIQLAEAGSIAGAECLGDVKLSAWEVGLTARERALLAASFRAGLLLVTEFRIRDPAAAIVHLTRVANALRGYHPVWYFLGEAYLLNAQFDEAELIWTEGLARSPGDPALQAVLRNLPVDRVHHAAKQCEWAQVLREIARLPPDGLPASERWTLEGDAHLALGNREMARQCWLRALEADRHAVGIRSRLRRLDRLTVL